MNRVSPVLRMATLLALASSIGPLPSMDTAVLAEASGTTWRTPMPGFGRGRGKARMGRTSQAKRRRLQRRRGAR